MENLQTQTQIKPRKKRKLQEVTPDPKCPYPDPITHAEATRLLGLSVYHGKIFMERRGISGYKGLKYIYRSKKEVLMKGFLWKYGNKGNCINFEWAQRILRMHEYKMETEIEWLHIYDDKYCTAMAIIELLYGKS